MNLFRPHCSLQKKKKEKYPLDFIAGHVSMNKITRGFLLWWFWRWWWFLNNFESSLYILDDY